jgi:hypothetical protein
MWTARSFFPPLYGEGQPGEAGQGGAGRCKCKRPRLAAASPPLTASRSSPPHKGEGRWARTAAATLSNTKAL